MRAGAARGPRSVIHGGKSGGRVHAAPPLFIFGELLSMVLGSAGRPAVRRCGRPDVGALCRAEVDAVGGPRTLREVVRRIALGQVAFWPTCNLRFRAMSLVRAFCMSRPAAWIHQAPSPANVLCCGTLVMEHRPTRPVAMCDADGGSGLLTVCKPRPTARLGSTRN